MILEGFNGALEMDAAGAFDEHDVAGAQILEEPAAGGFGVGEKERGDSAGAGGRGEVPGVSLDADDEVESGLGGGEAAGGVELGAMLALLEHFAGNQNAAACGGTRGQGANHGAQRLGVGVVAVIQNGDAGDFDDLAALVSGGECLERGDGGVEIDAGFKSDGEPGHGVGGVVLAEQMQSEGALAFAGAEVDVQAGEVFSDGDDLRVGAGAFAKVDDAAGKIAAELRDVGVAAVEEGDAV